MATARSKQAHHHTSKHYTTIWCTWSEPPTVQARTFASVSTLAGCGGEHRQGLAIHCTSGPVISSELTPLYDQRANFSICKLTPLYDQLAHTTLRPASSQHSMTSKLMPLYDQWNSATDPA
ncbi:hypothetical protein EMCRGX_G005163 [Ephydatia muelleri]